MKKWARWWTAMVLVSVLASACVAQPVTSQPVTSQPVKFETPPMDGAVPTKMPTPTTPPGPCDLLVIKKAEPTPARMGGPLNFVIVITNIGTGACPGPIQVVDGLPSGISPQQVTPPTACAINGNTVQCAFPGPLNPNASLTVTIHSTVKQGPVVNCASVETTGDLNAANNRSCVEVPVEVPVATPTKPPTPTLTPTPTPVAWCPAPGIVKTYTAGLADNFGSSPDPAPTPRPAFVTMVGSPPQTGFDSTNYDKHLLHTFSGLPTGIVALQLETKVKPLDQQPENDDLVLYSGTTPTLGFQTRIGTSGPPGLLPNPWNAVNYPAGQTLIVTLDTTNANASGLIAAMNSAGVLDVQIEDDTSVDYLTLRLCLHERLPTPTKPPTPTLTPTSTPVKVCEAQPYGKQSLDTGVDANGDGKDDRWTFVSGPSGTPGPAPIIPPDGAWDTLPGTQWLSGDPTGPNGTYIYRLTFCLPREVKEVGLRLQVLSDDIAQVYVNGNPVAATPSIPPCPGANQYCFKNPPPSFNLSVAASSLAPFVPGALNILEIRVQNTYGVVTGFDAAGVVYWQ